MAGFIDSINDTFTWLLTGKKPKKKVEVPYDPVYFQKVCKALRNSALEHPFISLQATLNPEYELTECQIHVRKDSGKHSKHIISEKSQEEIYQALVELRKHMVEKGGVLWLGVLLNLDVPKDSYNIDFRYK